jgi:MOSC domain-containing protein YiiM
MGTVEAIFLRPGARVPVRPVSTARAVRDQGLEGDHAVGGRRQVTILSREAWEAACRDFGQQVDPSVRRANLLVSGLDLAGTIGATLQIGGAQIDVTMETRPCELMDDGGRIGLCAALSPARRGGVLGVVREGGAISIGDPVEVAPTRA